LVTPIIKDLSLSYSQMGIILGAWQLTYVAVAAIGGAIIDRIGIRKTLLFGILLVGLSEALRYFANGFITMLFFVALLGLGGPMISIGCPKTISEWFRRKDRGTAVGIYMAGSSIGALLSFATINSIAMPLTRYSWRLTFFLYSLPAFSAALLWWFLARDVESTGAQGSSHIIKVFTDLIRIRNIRLILVMGLFSFSISHGFTNWLPKILETGGLSPAIAGFASSIPLIAAIPALLFIPSIVKAHLRGRMVALIAFVCGTSVLMVAMSSGIPLVIWLVFYGLTSTTTITLLILVMMDIPEVGAKYMGSAGGMFFCVTEIGGFAGPSVVGAIKDMVGSFLAAAILMAALALAITIMGLLLKIEEPGKMKTLA
jgi:cyanate permease